MEDIVYMVATWLNREYELTFFDSWFFNFYPEDDQMPGLLGNRIGTKNYNLWLLEKFCGISLTQNKEANAGKALEAVKQELAQGRPAAIYLDTFWCHWHVDYQKLHHDHFSLVIGIDSSENLFCIDQISNEICTLSKHDFLKGGGFYIIFNIMEQPQIKNYHDILMDSVNMTINNGTFDNIRKLIYHFEKDFNLDLEFQNMNTGIWDVLIHRNIGFIAGSRKNYARFLESIAKKLGCNEYFPQIQEFNSLSSRWNTSRAVLAKSYYTIFDQETKNIVIDLLYEIAEKEEQLAASLLEIRPEKTLMNIPNPVTDLRKNSLDSMNQSYTYLDLTRFFNNNAFGSAVSPDCSADLTGTGYYFLVADIPAGIISLPDGMSFLFPEVMDGQNDNIFCEKQAIHVSGKYHSIMILGCAEYGMFIENLTIEYEDGELVPMVIKLTDWAYEPIYGETVVWKGKVVEKKHDKATLLQPMNRIFAKEFQIPKNGVIRNIILPYCLNIHIFAITLCRYD